MAKISVVLDACVLFPASLRDTLLRAADFGLYRVCLTDHILEEVRCNLVEKRMEESKAQRLVDAVKENFDEAFISLHEYELLITSMPNHEGDRHVLAAAISRKARVIVTQNLKHFPNHLLSQFEVRAQSPDDFLLYLYHLDTNAMVRIITKQARDLRNPPKTVPELLDTLHQHAPGFVDLFRQKVSKDM